MKRTIPSVPQLYRNVRRWTEIVSVLSKYGLADWISRFNIDFLTDLIKPSEGESQSQLTQNARIRLALTELGPTFIKFGQTLSTRPDLIGPELAEELSKLQADVPADDFDDIKAIVEQDLGCELESEFSRFDPTPIASASIGQVHLAEIKFPESWKSENDNQRPNQFPPTAEVVVKVRHAHVLKKGETDLDILRGLAQLAERLDDFKNYQPVMIIRELSRAMRREMDFNREVRNILQFESLFKSEPGILFPKPVVELCSERMIVMHRIQGTKLRELQTRESDDFEPAELARIGANLYLKMIFNHGFYHADPHPGNILITDDGRIALLDFGLVGRISEQLREDIESMLVAIVNQDVPMLTTLIKRVGSCPIDLNESALSNDVADFVGQYSTQIVSHFDMSGALNDFIGVVRSYEITLPAEASLLIKTLVTLEGTGRLLDPNFSLMEIMKPFQRMLILKRLSPVRQARKLRRFYMEVEQLVDALPQRVANILEQVQTGRFDVHLVHRRLGPTANRIVVGLMTSALFLGSSLMLSYKVPPLLFPKDGPIGIHDLSVLGLTGFLVSMLMGLRLMWAIRKSGNLDQPDR
ncbi:MAG: AarF/UbiB family protein [Planctomycetota bacterium]